MKVSISDSESESDLEVVGEGTSEQNRLPLPSELADVVVALSNTSLPQSRLRCSSVTGSARHRPSMLQDNLSSSDRKALLSTFNRARKAAHANVAEHGVNTVDGSGFLTLKEDKWLQVHLGARVVCLYACAALLPPVMWPTRKHIAVLVSLRFAPVRLLPSVYAEPG